MEDMVARTVAEIEAEAVAKAGSADFGSGHYRALLAAWARDLQQPELSAFGQQFLRRLMLSSMARRLRVMAFLRAHPEIAEVQLPQIVLISGLPRTGTTIAHDLLALHARARAPLRWELVDPLPPPEAASYDSDPRIAKVQKAAEPLRGSLLEHMHWVNADEPEECVWGYLDGSNVLGRACMAVMPAWREQVMNGDPRPTFREYRALLALLLWHNPLPPGGVLVLKCPQIVGMLDAFDEVFPGARYVLLHRDPYRALVSSSTMLSAINAPFVNDAPPLRREQSGWLARSQAHALESLARFSDRLGERVVQLPYPELLDDGPAACERVLHALGLPRDPDFRARAHAFLERQESGQRAAPPASYDDFGYDHDEVLAEPRVAAYCRHFAVAPERVRRTGR